MLLRGKLYARVSRMLRDLIAAPDDTARVPYTRYSGSQMSQKRFSSVCAIPSAYINPTCESPMRKRACLSEASSRRVRESSLIEPPSALGGQGRGSHVALRVSHALRRDSTLSPGAFSPFLAPAIYTRELNVSAARVARGVP